MKDHHLEPARSVVAKLGTRVVAEVTGKHVSRIYRWMAPREKGGTGGFIPHEDANALIEYARAEGVDLSPGDFFPPSLAEAAE